MYYMQINKNGWIESKASTLQGAKQELTKYFKENFNESSSYGQVIDYKTTRLRIALGSSKESLRIMTVGYFIPTVKWDDKYNFKTGEWQ